MSASGPAAGAGRGGDRLRWVPAVLWAAVLFGLSAVPGEAYPRVPVWSADKVVHVLLYAPLGAAILWARAPRSGAGRRSIALAVVLCAAYGIGDELHQSFVPNRSPDGRDVAADVVGALAGAWLMARRRNRRARAGGGRDGQRRESRAAGQAPHLCVGA